MDKFLIIDGYNIIYRAFFALLNSTGKTNAVSVFFTSLLSLIKQTESKYVAICMDSKGDTLRKKDFPQYKANRMKAPIQLHEQANIIEMILDAFNIKAVSKVGYEADDLINSLVRKYKNQCEIYIASGDKDLLQLVNSKERVYQLRSDVKEDRWVIYDDEKVLEKYSIPPNKISSYLALLGDASDNVPGVDGIGEVSAKKLLQKYDNLDEIYKNLDEISKAVRNKLDIGKDDAYSSLQLVDLSNKKYECDIDGNISDYDINNIVPAMGIKALLDNNCINIANKFQKFLKEKNILDGNTNIIVQQDEKKEIEKAKLIEISVKDLFDVVEKSNKVSFVINNEKQILYVNDGSNIVYECVIDLENTKAEIAKLIQNFQGKIVGFNVKDIYKLKNYYLVCSDYDFDYSNAYYKITNYEENGLIDDIKIQSYCLESTGTNESIESLSKKYLDINLYKNINTSDSLFEESNENIYINYATATLLLYHKLQNELEKNKLCKLYEKIEKPLLPIVAQMEITGISLDSIKIKEIEKKLGENVENIKSQIYKSVGREFNIQSTKQLQDVIVNDLKISLTKKTQTGFSTDQEVLEELAQNNDVIRKILEYKMIIKLLQTYTYSLLNEVSKKDNKLHTLFLQDGTQTGRFSSMKPNLQNIPGRTREGKMIRECFVADSGYKLISSDYSQIELRVLAHLSKDKVLCNSFDNNLDVHRATACLLKGVDYNDTSINENDRNSAKTINFAVIYGMSAFSLAKKLKISNKEAQDFIDKYFDAFPGVVKLRNKINEQTTLNGWTITEEGRKRSLEGINSPNKMLRQRAERQALNSTIQGEAADIMKLALMNTAKAIREKNLDCKILLTVHDEIIVEARNEEVDKAMDLIKNSMENAAKLNVKLNVDISSGHSWGEL